MPPETQNNTRHAALDLMDQVGLGREERLVEDVHMSVRMGAPKEKPKEAQFLNKDVCQDEAIALSWGDWWRSL